MKKEYKHRWKANLVAEGRKILAGYRRGNRAGWRLLNNELVQGAWIHGHTLTVLVKRGRMLWLLDTGKVGVGFLRKSQQLSAWQVESAGISPEHRGQGIYPSVLKVLREWAGMPIASGKQLAPRAQRVWEKVGQYDPQTRGYRINPRGRV